MHTHYCPGISTRARKFFQKSTISNRRRTKSNLQIRWREISPPTTDEREYLRVNGLVPRAHDTYAANKRSRDITPAALDRTNRNVQAQLKWHTTSETTTVSTFERCGNSRGTSARPRLSPRALAFLCRNRAPARGVERRGVTILRRVSQLSSHGRQSTVSSWHQKQT